MAAPRRVTPPLYAVAVSGGPDSMALALLTARHCAAAGVGMLALTVDHGLRPEAGAEGRQVGRWLRRFGIAHRLLRWRHPPVGAALQEQARAARYTLLTAAAVRAGCLYLLTAHHADDQAETVLLRRAAGTGEWGLAGMSGQQILPDLLLLRPLLGVGKAALVDYCHEHNLPFLTDPSNQQRRFARARLRQDSTPADYRRAQQQARRAGRTRQATEQAMARLVWRVLRSQETTALTLDWPRLTRSRHGLLLLGRFLLMLGGGAYPPRRARLERAWARLSAATGICTLGGCILQRQGDMLQIRQEQPKQRKMRDLSIGWRHQPVLPGPFMVV